MAVGRNAPDQVSPGQGRSIAQTGLDDQTQHLRRDYQADREKAIRDQIKAYEDAGLETKHLQAQLGKKPENATGYEASVRFDGPAHLDPRKGEFSPPGEVYAPVPESVPEPEDLSAPDKRDQDQSPREVKGAGEQVVTAKDPGPEAPKRKDPTLPDQESPPTEPEKVPLIKTGDAKGLPPLPDQGPARDDDDPDKGKTAAKPGPAPAKKAQGKSAGTR